MSIRLGSTRHGPTVGRAIDLALCSPNVCAELTVHNGIHCYLQGSCGWTECVEFASGDHFFQQLLVEFAVAEGPIQALPRFPTAWRNKDRWHAALEKVKPLVSQCIPHLRLIKKSLPYLQRMSSLAQQWLVDAIA